MRVLVTGATGFVGRWLLRELASQGHEVIEAPGSAELDLAGRPDLASLMRDAQPDAVAHLAAVSYLPDAEKDPERASAVNEAGTAAVFAGLERAGSDAAVLVTSSADVYGFDAPLPISETAEVAPTSAYGQSKVAQEAVAIAAARHGRRVTIARGFNHIGPGQRPEFVVPALARRVLAARSGSRIRIGNIDSRRDFTDVRDVVRAYRMLLERMLELPPGAAVTIVNVGTGRSVSVEEILRAMCSIVGIEPVWHVDPAHVRSTDVRDRVADVTLLRSLISWESKIPLDVSLRDVLASTSV